MFTLLVVNALFEPTSVNIPPPEPVEPGRLVSLDPSPINIEADTPILADNSPTTFKVVPSNVRLDSHVSVLAFPPTFVTIALFVAFATLGILIISAPSDVLRLPETIEPLGKLSFVVSLSGRKTVPDKLLYATQLPP